MVQMFYKAINNQEHAKHVWLFYLVKSTFYSSERPNDFVNEISQRRHATIDSSIVRLGTTSAPGNNAVLGPDTAGTTKGPWTTAVTLAAVLATLLESTADHRIIDLVRILLLAFILIDDRNTDLH